MEEDQKALIEKKLEDYMNSLVIYSLEHGTTTTEPTKPLDSNKRNLFVMRHAERIDFCFGKWIPHSFDEAGNYLRKDLNLPVSLPKRKNGPEDYRLDGPITRVGGFVSKSYGEEFKSKNISIEYAYCSPSLRCVQTLDAFLEGLGKKDQVKIRIEPSLFECTVWYPAIPEWMSVEELVKAGYNIDTEYKPFMKSIDLKENIKAFYTRSANFAHNLIQTHESGNTIVVGHAHTLDSLTRKLVLNEEPRTLEELFIILDDIPFCSLIQLNEDEKGQWQYVEPPCPPMAHGTNSRFNWKILVPSA